MKDNMLLFPTYKRIMWLCALLILSASATQVSAQRSMVIATVVKYGIDGSFLDPVNLRTPTDRDFALTESTITAGKTKVLEAKFDPSAASREQWKVVSIDGKAPTLYETNMFRNIREKTPIDKPDERTYRIDGETADQLLISYKLDAGSIPMDAFFLKDCRVLLTVDLRAKQLVTLRVVNEKPVKIGPLTAEKFSILTTYTYNSTGRRYLPLKDVLMIEAAFLGGISEQALNADARWPPGGPVISL